MNNSEKILHVYSMPGLGDALWNLQKILPNTDRKIHLHTFERNNAYSSPFLKGIDRVETISQFRSPYCNLDAFRHKCYDDYNKIKNITPEELNEMDEIYMEANKWLESGVHLTQYFPNLKTTYDINWISSDEEKEKAKNVIHTFDTIVLYTSSKKTNSIKCLRPFWRINFWVDLLNEIFESYGNIKVVWIGANYDSDMMNYIKSHFPDSNIEYFINETPGFIISLMKQSKGFISYQSGLSCISIVEKVPTYMLYYDFLKKLPYQICHPDCKNNKNLYTPDYFKNIYESNIPILNWLDNVLEI